MSAEFDLVIRNATIPGSALVPCGSSRLPNPSAQERLDVGVSGGEIVAVGASLRTGAVDIDAEERWLLPGLIDNHVHYREPGAAFKEGYVTGSAASARGGATTVGEIQNNLPLITTEEQWRQKLESVRRRSRVRVMPYGNALKTNLPHLANLAAVAPGIKVFMSGSRDLEVHEAEDLRPICEEVARSDGLLIVHAEEGPLIDQGLRDFGKQPADYSKARSVAAEVVAVEKVLQLGRETGVRLHLFHISTAAACDAIAAARRDGVAVSASTCPHYLFFSDADVAQRGAVLKCNPSIKSERDRQGLRRALSRGDIDILSSDHAPHPAAEKEGPFESAPSGIPAADLFLPLLFQLVQEELLTVNQIVERACLTPAEWYRLPSAGRISEGAQADLVLVNRDSAEVTESCFSSKAKLSPYLGWKLEYWPQRTWVGGRLVFDRDQPEDLVRLEAEAPPALPGDSQSVCC